MPDFLPLVAAAGRNDLDYAAPGLPGRQIILRSARPARWTAQTPVWVLPLTLQAKQLWHPV